MAITGLTGVGTVDTHCSRSGHVGACRTVLTAGGQELLGVRVAGGAVLRPAPAGPALGVAGEAGARLPVQAGLAALALRRRAEAVTGGAPARGAGDTLGGGRAGVAAQGAGQALRPGTVRGVASRAVGDTPPLKVQRLSRAASTVRVQGAHTGVAGAVTGRAGARLLVLTRWTPHQTLPACQDSPLLALLTLPAPAPLAVPGTVHTRPALLLLPGARGTLGHTLGRLR